MAFPDPVPGLVVRYAYLWRDEQARGREEGVKDRPCALLFTVVDAGGQSRVTVLPITHAPPRNPDHAIEIPAATKRRLGLDGARSWIVLTEANRFTWPGPDLRPATAGEPGSISYGHLPNALFDQVRDRWLELYRQFRGLVTRTE